MPDPQPPPPREALFAPYRALGVVSSGVPLALRRAGAATFATAAVGKAWIVYECGKLKTAVVGPLLPHTITALAVSGDLTLAVSGRAILAHKRLHAVGRFRPPPGHGRPACLAVIGGTLLAVARDRRAAGPRPQWSLLVWNLAGGKGGPAPVAAHAFDPGFVPTALTHPPTFVDKVLVGGADGSTQLWNFVAGAMLHASTVGADAAAAAGPGGGRAAPAAARPALRTMCPAPALDIVALGFANGVVALVDVRADVVLTVLRDAAGTGAAAAAAAGPAGAVGAAAGPPLGGAVTALSFCTAPGAAPLLAVGGAAGCLALWDLETARLAGVLPHAHAPGSPVTTAHWFAGEARLLTGGGDNALRQWALAAGGGGGGAGGSGTPAMAASLASASAPLTLLRSRTGHAAPPALVRFYGADGTRLLSAGSADRSLRLVSAIQDAQSRELSQGPGLGAQARRLRVEVADLKLPRVVALDACPTRERDWANVLTAHAGDPAARTWTIRDGAASGRALLPPTRPGVPPRTAPATAVAITGCGNYALVGSAAGHVDRYNMQSSLYRGGCTRPGEGTPGTPGARRAKRAHDKAVTGLAPDASGRRAASVGLDGFLRVWDLRTGKPLAGVDLGAPAGRLAAHAGGALLAIALEPPAGAGGGGGGGAAAAAAPPPACGVRVYDIGATAAAGPPRLVRRFFTGGGGGGGTAAHPPPPRFTDLAFSADGRWLVASSLDGCVRVADVPSGAVRQTVRLGGPVVSLALSPAGDVLATAHAGRRGICLWSNQAVFGSAGAAPPAGEGAPAVRVKAPVLVAPGGGDLDDGGEAAAPGRAAVTMAGGGGLAPVGEEEESEGEEEGGGALSSSSSDTDGGGDGARSMSSSSDDDADGGLDLAAGFESSDDGFASDGDDEDAGPPEAAAFGEAEPPGDSPPPPLTAADGAPAPLAPSLITTSLLPRAQWRSLAHLDEVRARNKPLAPPTKPAAAPFFLPTVPTLAGQPVFDTAMAEAGEGVEAGPAPLKRPRHAAAGLVALLRACAATPLPPGGLTQPPPGAWAPAAAWLRGAPPSAVDRELAAMVLLDEGAAGEGGGGGGGGAGEEADVGHLLAFVDAKVAAGTDWELVQAFLSAALRAHGPAIASRPALRERAGRLAARLKARVARLDGLADAVLASAAFVGGLPV